MHFECVETKRIKCIKIKLCTQDDSLPLSLSLPRPLLYGATAAIRAALFTLDAFTPWILFHFQLVCVFPLLSFRRFIHSSQVASRTYFHSFVVIFYNFFLLFYLCSVRSRSAALLIFMHFLIYVLHPYAALPIPLRSRICTCAAWLHCEAQRNPCESVAAENECKLYILRFHLLSRSSCTGVSMGARPTACADCAS